MKEKLIIQILKLDKNVETITIHYSGHYRIINIHLNNKRLIPLSGYRGLEFRDIKWIKELINVKSEVKHVKRNNRSIRARNK